MAGSALDFVVEKQDSLLSTEDPVLAREVEAELCRYRTPVGKNSGALI